MNAKIKGILFLCLLFAYSCAPEDDILQNTINIYPDINVKYYNGNDSLRATVNFHSINSFGQSIKLLDESNIFFNDHTLLFDTTDGSYYYTQTGRPDSNIISWFHQENFYRVALDMNTFYPALNNNPLKLDQTDSLHWSDENLELYEYVSFYAGDSVTIQYHFQDEFASNAMLIDSTQFRKFNKDSVIFIVPSRVKQFDFNLKGYRGSTGATRIFADTIYTQY